ncbi:pentatricopeptide (PPR) repeat-containing protein [Wolffia australiana]
MAGAIVPVAPPPPPPPRSPFLPQRRRLPLTCAAADSPPSLADQLKPLCRTILRDRPSPPDDPSAAPPPRPRSTWVNPSRPRPSVLSPRRQPRRRAGAGVNSERLAFVSRALDGGAAAFAAAAADLFPTAPSLDEALAILSGLRAWQKSLLFLDWLRSLGDEAFPMETILYNVAMKALRVAGQLDLVDGLAEEMLAEGRARPDNITYSTVITCAKRRRRYARAIEWFERMYRAGVTPDEVTYSAALDVYARLGRADEVVALYERARAAGWAPDAVAFSVLARVFGEAGDYDGIRYVMEEMKAVGVRPNLVVYNTLLEALGRAGKPGLARSLFEEMTAAGLAPNEKTLTALAKIYGKARWSRDALLLWDQMKANGWPVDLILYNTLLSMCADVGLEPEAERLFADMKAANAPPPDGFSYTAMVNVYASAGRADRAREVFHEMLAAGVLPNVMSCTCLIQCLGRARRIDEAVEAFDLAMANGVRPDDRLSGCLLSVLAFCAPAQAPAVLARLDRANPGLVRLLRVLGDAAAGPAAVEAALREVMESTAADARRPFCNCLIDVCQSQGFPAGRTGEIFLLGKVFGLYPGLEEKKPEEWTLNVRSLSVGAAKEAFQDWAGQVRTSLLAGAPLPAAFAVETGAGTHKFSQGLAAAFAAHVEALGAPFRWAQEEDGRRGCFLASKDDLLRWILAT